MSVIEQRRKVILSFDKALTILPCKIFFAVLLVLSFSSFIWLYIRLLGTTGSIKLFEVFFLQNTVIQKYITIFLIQYIFSLLQVILILHFT